MCSSVRRGIEENPALALGGMKLSGLGYGAWRECQPEMRDQAVAAAAGPGSSPTKRRHDSANSRRSCEILPAETRNFRAAAFVVSP
jgi:hypothetical protein